LLLFGVRGFRQQALGVDPSVAQAAGIVVVEALGGSADA
jgi:hypothetical protein